MKVNLSRGGVIVEGWFLISELAEELNIPENTVRRYAGLFKDFMPCKKIGRATRYAPEALDILTRISELYNKGYDTEGVHSMLESEGLTKQAEVSDGGDNKVGARPQEKTLFLLEEILSYKDEFMEMHRQNQELIQELHRQNEKIIRQLDTQNQQLIQRLDQENRSRVRNENELFRKIEEMQKQPKKQGQQKSLLDRAKDFFHGKY